MPASSRSSMPSQRNSRSIPEKWKAPVHSFDARASNLSSRRSGFSHAPPSSRYNHNSAHRFVTSISSRSKPPPFEFSASRGSPTSVDYFDSMLEEDNESESVVFKMNALTGTPGPGRLAVPDTTINVSPISTSGSHCTSSFSVTNDITLDSLTTMQQLRRDRESTRAMASRFVLHGIAEEPPMPPRKLHVDTAASIGSFIPPILTPTPSSTGGDTLVYSLATGADFDEQQSVKSRQRRDFPIDTSDRSREVELQRKINNLEKMIEEAERTHREEKKRLTSEINHLKIEVRRLTDVVTELDGSPGGWNQSLATETQQKLESLKRELEAKQFELEELRGENEQQSRTIQDQERTIQHQQRIIKGQTSTIFDRDRKISEIAERCSKAEEKTNQVVDRFHGIARKNMDLTKQNKEFETKHDRNQKELQERDSCIKSLRSRLIRQEQGVSFRLYKMETEKRQSLEVELERCRDELNRERLKRKEAISTSKRASAIIQSPGGYFQTPLLSTPSLSAISTFDQVSPLSSGQPGSPSEMWSQQSRPIRTAATQNSPKLSSTTLERLKAQGRQKISSSDGLRQSHLEQNARSQCGNTSSAFTPLENGTNIPNRYSQVSHVPQAKGRRASTVSETSGAQTFKPRAISASEDKENPPQPRATLPHATKSPKAHRLRHYGGRRDMTQALNQWRSPPSAGKIKST